MAEHEKAAGDHASGQIRVRKRMRVEMSPAPVGPRSNGKSLGLSVKNETQEPAVGTRRTTVAARQR
ncbi:MULTISPECIES: hypothetical protein [Bradyrhizobium]|uniref:hypothetical protein n=1 Tax=Bradyrhizobium TaxID=374 RepID=UPI001177B830|nr:hypothetical protein [Bradyrhizobium canariense]